jgi:hypothetical protein
MRGSLQPHTHQEHALVIFCRTCSLHSALMMETDRRRGTCDDRENLTITLYTRDIFATRRLLRSVTFPPSYAHLPQQSPDRRRSRRASAHGVPCGTGRARVGITARDPGLMAIVVPARVTAPSRRACSSLYQMDPCCLTSRGTRPLTNPTASSSHSEEPLRKFSRTPTRCRTQEANVVDRK